MKLDEKTKGKIAIALLKLFPRKGLFSVTMGDAKKVSKETGIPFKDVLNVLGDSKAEARRRCSWE